MTHMRWCKLKVMCTNTVVSPYSISKTLVNIPLHPRATPEVQHQMSLPEECPPLRKLQQPVLGVQWGKWEGDSMETKWTYLHSAVIGSGFAWLNRPQVRQMHCLGPHDASFTPFTLCFPFWSWSFLPTNLCFHCLPVLPVGILSLVLGRPKSSVVRCYRMPKWTFWPTQCLL